MAPAVIEKKKEILGSRKYWGQPLNHDKIRIRKVTMGSGLTIDIKF